MSENQKRDKGATRDLYEKTLPLLANGIHAKLAEITPLFRDFHLEKMMNTWSRSSEDRSDLPISIENGNVLQMGLRLRLEDFQRAGVIPFSIVKDMVFNLEDTVYQVVSDKGEVWQEKGYYQQWSKQEVEDLTRRWCDALIEDITNRLEQLMG
ncbi:hypothetical protein [Cesiribacter sp. SM1]|uniref:hypothetical protein n=1 Tax=Cesiribacter sp. SM1 TaxID=2861196 RepID=UPI001CD42715|nr:hypothetical protein [Cesiribacter sp. SM1]